VIEEYNEQKRIPQVQGGQGRTDESVNVGGWLALYVALGIIVLLVAGFMFGGC